MGKRFTATEKWDDPFFCELDQNHKLAWIYLLDKCDNAGIYDVNIKTLNFFTGFEFDKEELIKKLGKRVTILNEGSKWFIPKFIEFQYGVLTEDCYPHRPVIEKLKKYGLLENKGSFRVVTTLQEKDIYKDKEKDKDKDKENAKTVEKKMTDFELEVMEYKGEYSPEILREFWEYWSELNKSKTKMKKELQDTWDTPRRLKTWMRNKEKFEAKNGNGTSKQRRKDYVTEDEYKSGLKKLYEG